jgi:hypothetical protein
MKGLVKKQNAEIMQYDFEAQADDGLDEIQSHDLPRSTLKIAHQMSPYCNPQNEKFIQGCQPGMIVNPSLREIYSGDESDGVIILPVKYMNRLIEWRPNREGFVAEHVPGSERVLPGNLETRIIDEKPRTVMKDTGNLLVDTAVFHCFMIKPETKTNRFVTFDQVVIDMTSTQWGTAKDLNAHLKSRVGQKRDGSGMYRKPAYSGLYQFFTRYKEDKGNSWHIWKFNFLRDLDITLPEEMNLYKTAIEYIQMLSDGQIKVNHTEN